MNVCLKAKTSDYLKIIIFCKKLFHKNFFYDIIIMQLNFGLLRQKIEKYKLLCLQKHYYKWKGDSYKYEKVNNEK